MKDKNIGRETFLEFLLRRGHKVTKPRLRIVDTIFSRQKFHFDAEELLKLVNETGRPRVSRATVYRTLELLEESGLVRRDRYGTAVSHYERTIGEEHHDHLICNECGKITEFYSQSLEKLKRAVCKDKNFTPTRHVFQIYGVCSSCARKFRY